jgi:hypothetical protein
LYSKGMNMFKPTDAQTPRAYIDAIDEPRKSDIVALHELVQKAAPGLAPHIAYGMIAYGSYHYKSKSGREGEWSTIALASQKSYISLYVSCVKGGHYLAEEYQDRLPKADIGKSCVRFKRLSDVDTAVLDEMLREAAAIGGASPA